MDISVYSKITNLTDTMHISIKQCSHFNKCFLLNISLSLYVAGNTLYVSLSCFDAAVNMQTASLQGDALHHLNNPVAANKMTAIYVPTNNGSDRELSS